MLQKRNSASAHRFETSTSHAVVANWLVRQVIGTFLALESIEGRPECLGCTVAGGGLAAGTRAPAITQQHACCWAATTRPKRRQASRHCSLLAQRSVFCVMECLHQPLINLSRPISLLSSLSFLVLFLSLSLLLLSSLSLSLSCLFV